MTMTDTEINGYVRVRASITDRDIVEALLRNPSHSDDAQKVLAAMMVEWSDDERLALLDHLGAQERDVIEDCLTLAKIDAH